MRGITRENWLKIISKSLKLNRYLMFRFENENIVGLMAWVLNDKAAWIVN